MNQTSQLNIAMHNQPGSLEKVSRVLADHDINIEAIVCTEGKEESVIHIIVDNLALASEVLQPLGTVNQTPVFTFEMKNKPGAIASISAMCGAAGINIRNMYATTDGEQAMVYVSVDDPERFRDLYAGSVEC